MNNSYFCVLKDNILVSEKGNPLLCDFGISRMIAITQTMGGGGAGVESTNLRGSARWMSPELLLPPDDESPLHTKNSDIWAFGMTAYVSPVSLSILYLLICVAFSQLLGVADKRAAIS